MSDLSTSVWFLCNVQLFYLVWNVPLILNSFFKLLCILCYVFTLTLLTPPPPTHTHQRFIHTPFASLHKNVYVRAGAVLEGRRGASVISLLAPPYQHPRRPE